MKRYAVTIDLYVHAENDQDALQQAQAMAETVNGKEDNQASVLELSEIPFGSIKARKVDLSHSETTISDCCSADPIGASIEMGICSDCKEHCEYITLHEASIKLFKHA